MTNQGGGGGASYPDVVPDGRTPGGLIVGGQIQLTLLWVSGASSIAYVGPGYITLQRGTDDNLPLEIDLSPGSSGRELGMYDSDGGAMWEIDADGTERLAGGIGLHGHAAQLTPRTLAQSVITAITDSNAKAAIQSIANALDDIGALTLT